MDNFLIGLVVTIGFVSLVTTVGVVDLCRFQSELLKSLESIKNEEGNKLIPTIKLEGELSSIRWMAYRNVVITVSILMGSCYVYFG